MLQSVVDTEITPELVPAGEDEEMQSSEAKVGPYVLQDFSLYQVLRYGFRPSKMAFLAWHAWSDADRGDWPSGYPMDNRPAYSLSEIRHWLQVFVQRFYSFSQFKRSALPNGPKVSPVVRCRPAGIGARRRTCPRGSGSTRSSARCLRTEGVSRRRARCRRRSRERHPGAHPTPLARREGLAQGASATAPPRDPVTSRWRRSAAARRPTDRVVRTPTRWPPCPGP